MPVRYPELHFRWSWRLRSTPEQLWPYVADTNRFNRDVGLPAVQPVSEMSNARRRLRFAPFGIKVDWDEEPFEWLRPSRFSVRRFYRSGPVAFMRATCTLTAAPGGGTQLVYETWVRARNLLGLIGLPFAMGIVNRVRFGRAFRRYDQAAQTERIPELVSTEAPHFAPGGETRLRDLSAELRKTGVDAHLVEQLEGYLGSADEMALARIQPYALADAWNLPRRDVLDLALKATRVGLLDLEWDVLCPLCRGAKQSAGTLTEVGGNVHCDTCNVDLSANLEGAVELRFSINSSVRSSTRESFCVAGPQVTPHIVMQQLLPAGQSRQLSPALERGRYRLRALDVPGGQYISVSDEGAASLRTVVHAEGWPADAEVSLTPTLTLENARPDERLLVLEHLTWADTAATAADVIRMQSFRDLFGGELLRPGQDIGINSLTIAFTDLRDSTKFYQQVGDAAAFGRVLDHFGLLREELSKEDGALIKTIGDAVMAVFPRPINGVRAMLAAQRRLSAPNSPAPGLSLKVGLHEGRCIAVTLNERLDYFGSTVNLASRLEKYSQGNDLIVSDAVRNDPEVAGFIESDGALWAEPFEAQIEGFDEVEFRLWRIRVGPGDITSD